MTVLHLLYFKKYRMRLVFFEVYEFYRIWGPQSGDYEEFCPLRYNAV
jgi:hypothetical protein